MAPPGDLDALSPTELKALVIELLGKVAALERTVAVQRAEIARLKGLKSRPQLKPSGMEKASDPKPPSLPKSRRGPVTPRVAIEDRILRATVPPGSRFKGYADFLVQDLVLRARCNRYRRERWLTPEGQLIVAPLPGGVDRHFGPELRRFVLAQYHQGQVTVPRLVAQLRAVGLAISTRQVMRLLIQGQQRFLDEARDVLRAGLAHAAWITVDDTGARHKAANGTCTQIGNDHFAWFGTTASKSRLNFLELLRAGHPDYVINAEALAYLRERALAGSVIERLATHPEQHFPDQAAWQAHLERLGIAALTVTPDPVRIATEGALWGGDQGARPAAPDGDCQRRCRPVRHRLACPVLGARRAPRAQARHLHRSPAQGAAVPASADLVVLPRPQGLPERADPAAPDRVARPLRPHL